MGGYWGINRTMAEIHALLFAGGEPLCTDDVMAQLHVSRGNASMNLRGLVDWGLVQRVHKFGDRKEYFQADTDIWRMFETILRERRRREVEPILDTLHRCRTMLPEPGGEAGTAPATVPAFARRLAELERFLNTMNTLFELALQFGSDGVDALLELASATSQAAGTPPPAPEAPPARRTRRHARPPRTRSRKANP
jgi:DNA-binding transcriptional regulator GbsR (MarR family)